MNNGTKMFKVWNHLRNGTLLERLAEEVYWRRERAHRRRKQRETARWQDRAERFEYFETTIQRGVRMRLYFDSVLSRLIYLEDFERGERRFLNRYLKRGDVFVDIGANAGLFTLIAAWRVGADGAVYAIEPSSVTCKRLIENININRNDNIIICNHAISDRSGYQELTVSVDGFDGWNSLGRPTAGASFVTENVATKTLDEFMEEHELIGKVNMMKIDVEGWETRVLAGGMEVLTRADAPILQVEFTEENCRFAGTSCRELYRMICDVGYKLYVYNPKANQIIPDPLREHYPYLNLIAAKDPDSVNRRIVSLFPHIWG